MAVLYSACLCKPLCFVDEMQILLRIPLLPDDPGGGNGNPLQYSCLENPMGREAWRATVHGVTKSQTCLSTLSCFFLLGNIFVKAKRKYINKCTWGVIALGFCSLSWHLKPIGLEKKKKSLDYCDSRRYAYRLVLLLLYASQWKWASHLFKDSSMHPSQIYWIGDFHWLCFSKHQFRLTASSHISINAIHNKSTRHSKALGAVVWKLSDS